jgi:ABC-type polysaccharide/polyol phosphate export permease
MLNPLSTIITGYRALQIDSVAFPWSTASTLGFIWPVLMLGLAFYVFQRAQRNFADWL